MPHPRPHVLLLVVALLVWRYRLAPTGHFAVVPIIMALAYVGIVSSTPL